MNGFSLESLGVYPLVGILLWISALIEKFIVLPMLLKKIPEDLPGEDSLQRRKEFLSRVMNGAILVLIALGAVFFFGLAEKILS